MMQHPILGWIPCAPEPFWVRRWFRWKPACYPCRITFKTRDEHERHWLTTHRDPTSGGNGGNPT